MISPLDTASRARTQSGTAPRPLTPGLVSPGTLPKPQVPNLFQGAGAAAPRPGVPAMAQKITAAKTPSIFQRALSQVKPPAAPAQPPAPNINMQRPNIAPMAPQGGALPPPQQQPPSGLSVTPGVQPPRPNIGPMAPQDQGGAITDFGPGNDLRFQQINPLDSARTNRLSDQTSAAADKVANGPDLAKAGLDKLAELRQGLSEDRRIGMQDIGRSAAKFGRLGAGQTTSQLGDLESSLQARELAAEKGLSGDLTLQEAADRRANAGTLAGLQDQSFGQGAQQRNELRGERGYETDTAQRDLENRIRQRALEEELTQGAFGRDLATAQTGLQAGQIQGQTAQGEQQAGGDVLSNLGLQDSLAQYMTQYPGVRRPRANAPDQWNLPEQGPG